LKNAENLEREGLEKIKGKNEPFSTNIIGKNHNLVSWRKT
jgi:hypothetical protein